MNGDSGKSWVGSAVSIGGAGATAVAAGGAAGAGAAAGGAAASAPSAGFLGISPVGWVVIGVAIIGSFLMRGKKKGPPPEAKGIRLGTPVDANAPWVKVYGEPWGSPPLVNQYAEPERLNSSAASTLDQSRRRVTGRPVFVCHAGAGPIDGKGLQVRYGGQYLTSQIVTTDSPAEQQTLTAKPGTSGAVWLFPAIGGELDTNSVQLYVDGVLVWSGSAGAGNTGTTDTESVGPSLCTAENFTAGATAFTFGNKDTTIPSFETRCGCYLPKSGDIDEKSITATVHLTQSNSLVGFYFSGSKRSTTTGVTSYGLTQDDFGFSQTTDGKQYFYVRKVTVGGANGTQVTASSTQRKITGFTLSYKVKKNSKEVSVAKAADGSYEARFSPPVSTSSTVKATYRVSTTFEDARYVLRTGTLDQKPATDEDKGFFGARDDATRTTVLVGLELSKGTKRTYTTTAEVDDVLVGIESGPKGFYGSSSDGSWTGLGRSLAMRFKETSAADTGATKPHDPSTGWVNLKPVQPDPKYGDSIFRLRDGFQGVGTWFYSVADLFEFTRTGKLAPNQRNWLPAKSYMVEVTALDAAGLNESGIVDTDRYFSDLYFGNATEIRRVGMVLPGQATLTVALSPDADDGSKLEAKFAGASVVQPSSSSATVGDDGLPTPRTVGYSRNPVWCACDFITDPLVGGGRIFSWSDVDISSAYTAAAWCDETITLRDGSTQVRSLCDVVIGEDGRKPLGEHIATILAGSGVFCYWSGGRAGGGNWKFVVDEDADVVTDPVTSSDFTIVEEQDCLPAACELSFASAEELPTELVVQFRDSENADAESQEPVYFDDPQPTPRVTERVEFPAVRRRKQARHFGGILLRQMRLATRRLTVVGTIGRGLRLLALEPGDIVKFTSTRLGLSAVKFRVMGTGFASDLRPALELVEHVSSAYTESFAGPNSGVRPGERQVPEETPAPSQLTVKHVTSTASLQTVGGAP